MWAQQSVQSSIPKSGLAPLCKDGEYSDQDWRPHVLLDPSENDVITRGRRRDKEIMLSLFFRCLTTMCFPQARPRRYQQHGLFANRKYLHFQRKGPRCLTLRCSVVLPHHSKRQSSSTEGNYLALVSALSSPKAASFTRGFSHPPLLSSVVSSSRSLILQWVFLLATEGKNVLPSQCRQSEDSSMQAWCFAGECASVSACVCLCA